MKTIRKTIEFQRDIKRAKLAGKDLSEIGVLADLLKTDDPLPPEYHDHSLRGNWAGYRECHLEGDWLVIYRISEDTILFVRTGTHAELFM